MTTLRALDRPTPVTGVPPAHGAGFDTLPEAFDDSGRLAPARGVAKGIIISIPVWILLGALAFKFW